MSFLPGDDEFVLRSSGVSVDALILTSGGVMFRSLCNLESGMIDPSLQRFGRLYGDGLRPCANIPLPTPTKSQRLNFSTTKLMFVCIYSMRTDSLVL